MSLPAVDSLAANSTYDLCIFDMDGVLVDSSGCHRVAFERLWQRCGIVGPAYDDIAGRSTHEVVREVTAALHLSPRQIDEWVAFKQSEARTLLTTEPIVYDDTLPALCVLQERGIPMAVATGASRTTADLILGRAGLRPFFCTLVTAQDITRGKPDPEIYRCALARTGVAASRSVIVEDSMSGIDAGLACGAAVLCVRTGLVRPHAAFLGSFPDLRAAVDRIGINP